MPKARGPKAPPDLATIAHNSPPTSRSSNSSASGRWTHEEHTSFVAGLREHGKNWKLIASMVPTRTVVQIRTHAQKYFLKLDKAKSLGYTDAEAAERVFMSLPSSSSSGNDDDEPASENDTDSDSGNSGNGDMVVVARAPASGSRQRKGQGVKRRAADDVRVSGAGRPRRAAAVAAATAIARVRVPGQTPPEAGPAAEAAAPLPATGGGSPPLSPVPVRRNLVPVPTSPAVASLLGDSLLAGGSMGSGYGRHLRLGAAQLLQPRQQAAHLLTLNFGEIPPLSPSESFSSDSTADTEVSSSSSAPISPYRGGGNSGYAASAAGRGTVNGADDLLLELRLLASSPMAASHQTPLTSAEATDSSYVSDAACSSDSEDNGYDGGYGGYAGGYSGYGAYTGTNGGVPMDVFEAPPQTQQQQPRQLASLPPPPQNSHQQQQEHSYEVQDDILARFLLEGLGFGAGAVAELSAAGAVGTLPPRVYRAQPEAMVAAAVGGLSVAVSDFGDPAAAALAATAVGPASGDDWSGEFSDEFMHMLARSS